DWLRSTTRDEAHLEVARLLGPRSAVIVPIRGRAGLLGVLTIATLDPHRRYDASDLAAAQAVADRAALAIDNARLHAQVLQAKKLRDEFLAIVSHDLRNPLNAILLHARVMARSGEATEATQSIIRAAKHAESLIADLLSVAALEAGSMPLPAGGRVRVEARRAHDDIVFTVADDGPGIPPESIRHVFDRFWQGAHARKAGAGLGLAIAKGIVEEHGGTISVESAPGGGATFTVTLPGSARS
ncbi:MAG TPA: HAMP domain-containing sensor histidine kinase, partial [Polyangiaceae bacterium]|nr:HAMP domain-containing sensor histidine kinase [Polyangiaceae bacterium]